jgi:hypothetical protein
MKKYHIILLLTLSLCFTQCNNVLEPEVYDQLSPENFFKTEADLKSALTPFYATFGTDWGYETPGTGVYAFNFGVAFLGYDWVTRMTTDQPFDYWNNPESLYTWGPANWPSSGQNHSYSRLRFVARATDVINRIEKAPVVESVKNKYLAEARVMRAWYMFILYDLYGPLNVKLDPTTLTSNVIEPRLSREAYVAAMETDLLTAIAAPELPDRLNGDATNWGRASKGLARMILLKIYMQETRAHDSKPEYWSKAEAVATELTTMGYSLLSNYKDVFGNNLANNEIIYAVPGNPGLRQYWYTLLLPTAATSVLGADVRNFEKWHGEGMRWEFYDKYSANDRRLETIASSYVNRSGQVVNRSNGLQAAIPVKYTNFKAREAFDYVIYRYADVLLSMAEIKNELNGPTSEAVGYARQVTDRAGITIPTSALASKGAFRTFLLDERGRELYSEFGIRRQDLIRHGKLIEYARARGIAIADSRHLLFPIPSDVMIESSGTITQNPGYPEQ